MKIDYSQKASWYQIPAVIKAVDTFFIYPTEYMGLNEGDADYATLDNEEMLNGVKNEYMGQASAYENSTNVFLPYYRQASLRYAAEVWKKTGSIDAALYGIPYDDLAAALDYYFENYNGGRPFILASHSQGSAMARLVLKKYFKEHPDYYKRMIAAYVIGYSITKEDLEENPHLKFATGETDTGVIVSWNTEGRQNVEENASNVVVLPNAICINPLNWSRDETYAPASENLGSFVANEKTGEYEFIDVGADAQINLARGTVVTNGKVPPMPEYVAKISAYLFGPAGRHEEDYAFYYNNIRDNVAKRIAAYFANLATDYSRAASWYQIPAVTKAVDTFFIYPTEYMGLNEGDADYATLDNEDVRQGLHGVYLTQASVFEDATNIFIPYYQQASLRYATEVQKKTGSIDAAISTIPYDDITGALDYYFENCNGGRPFILASHSQGSAIARLVLKKYFKEHPDYYARMVAAYVIGYAVTQDELDANPHLKFATGESDTGVIVSWNTEGPKNVELNAKTAVLLPNAISINPINWKRDDTYAPASENLGSLMPNIEAGRYEIVDAGADAQVIPSRGVVVTHAEMEPFPEELAEIFNAAFGPDGRHETDYALYYNNIKDNVAKRIAAYLAGKD